MKAPTWAPAAFYIYAIGLFICWSLEFWPSVVVLALLMLRELAWELRMRT